jgi:hypothetical protein
MKRIFWAVLFYFGFGMMWAQNVSAPIHGTAAQTVDRIDIVFGQHILHTAIKPYRRDDLVRFGMQVYKDSLRILDAFDVQSIFTQNNEFSYLYDEKEDSIVKVFIDSTRTFYTQNTIQSDKGEDLFPQSRKPVLKSFYKTPAHLFEINTEDFYLKVNPILHMGLGRGFDEDASLFINQRGISLRGGIDQKVYFSTQILESQVRFPNYVNDFSRNYSAVPGAGFFKEYSLDFFDVQQGRDFLLAQAYVGFNISKHIGLQFGHGTNFIGDGYRSLLLSDFSAPYFYLKLNTRVWKFHYQNIFAELAARGTRDDSGDKRIP